MSRLKYLLPPVDRYFKANLHTHSTISDGRLTPEELKAAYKAKGYSILSITDHDVVADHSALNEPDFLFLTGAEYDISEKNKPIRGGHCKTYHINCIAKQPGILWQPFANEEIRDDVIALLKKASIEWLPREYNVDAINAIISRANETGHLVTYNHPHWSGQAYPDYAGLKGLWGMEICNYSAMRKGFADRENGVVYRDLVNLSEPVCPLCADDTHIAEEVGGGWIMVGAEKLEYSSVIQALELGDFYASIGPEIHSLTFDGTTLRVTCSDAAEVSVICGNRFALRVTAEHNEGLLREAEFDLRPWLEKNPGLPEYWLRVRVQDTHGHYATTRAYRKEDLIENC